MKSSFYIVPSSFIIKKPDKNHFNLPHPAVFSTFSTAYKITHGIISTIKETNRVIRVPML